MKLKAVIHDRDKKFSGTTDHVFGSVEAQVDPYSLMARFHLERLVELLRAAIVVEGDYPDLFRTQRGRGSWLADKLGRLAVRYPEVPVIFAGSRKFAEEWPTASWVVPSLITPSLPD